MRGTLSILGWLVMTSTPLCTAAAQTPPAEPKPAERPAEKTADPKPAQPSLDDLLNIPKAKPADQTHPGQTHADETNPEQPKPTDPARADLDRRLANPDVADDFVQAVTLMRETSDRLTTASDVGLETQRLQQEVLLRLDKMIEQAKKNQKSKQKQGKPKPDQQQDQGENQQQQQSSQQQKKAQQGQQEAASAQGGNVPKQNAQPKAPPAGASASWGDLPPHVRDALLQGFSDKFSATYEQMTQEYYKRLAEQKPAPSPTPAPTPPGGGR